MLKKKYSASDTGGAWLMLRPLVLGTCTGVVLTAVLLYSTAAVITWQRSLPEELLGGLITVVLCLAAAAGGFVSAFLSGNKGLIYGAATGILLALIILISGIGLYSFEISFLILIKILMMVLSAAIAGILTVNRRTKVHF